MNPFLRFCLHLLLNRSCVCVFRYQLAFCPAIYVSRHSEPIFLHLHIKCYRYGLDKYEQSKAMQKTSQCNRLLYHLDGLSLLTIYRIQWMLARQTGWIFRAVWLHPVHFSLILAFLLSSPNTHTLAHWIRLLHWNVYGIECVLFFCLKFQWRNSHVHVCIDTMAFVFCSSIDWIHE